MECARAVVTTRNLPETFTGPVALNLSSPNSRRRSRPPLRDEIGEQLVRIAKAAMFLLLIIGTSSLAYYFLEHGEYSYVDCLYMAVITVSTVGYGEVIPVDTPLLRVITMLLIITGTGAIVYFASMITALIVEGDLNHWFSARRVQQQIDKLSGHTIVCGVGSTGRHTVEELMASNIAVVAVDQHPEKVSHVEAELGQAILHVTGDAAEDEVLEKAGIQRAKNIVCALSTDRDNLFVVVTAKKLNPKLRIVSRVIDETARIKLLRAGADSVISPNQLGGRRMAVDVLRPEVVSFLELMLREADRVMQIEQIEIPAGSPYDGVTLGQTDLRANYGLLVVAVIENGGEAHYAPGPKSCLRAGSTLIVFGERHQLDRLHKEW